jgi:ABC-type uncharacterized transport system permease subunit
LESLLQLFDADFFGATIRLSTPILFATLGGILNERSGVINIGLEGIMLMAALTGVLGAWYLNTPWLGFLCGLITGGLIGWIHAFVSVSLKANQIVSGAAINIIGLGLSSFLIRILFGLKDQQRIVPHFNPVKIPILGDIPFLGPILFQQHLLVYLAIILVPIFSIILYRTRWGLMVLAAGEHPRAADTVGINPDRVRFACVILSGVLAAAGGAFMSLGQLHFFMDEMVGGRGFIALAALIFGRWDPVGGLIACLVFGGADALQFRAQGVGFEIPHQFMLMFPYVLTLAILVIFGGRSQGPAAIGIPYRKGVG